MVNVRVKHPALYRQFADGFFTIAKTQNSFSMIGFDQKPERQNKGLKMRGATLNLSDECVFTEWAVAGPEIARVITEFEAGMRTRKNAVLKHHYPIPSVQQRFFRTLQGTGHSIACNPFDEDSHELVIIPDNVPRANQDAQNPPPWQSTQIPQQKQECEQHQGRQALTKATIRDNARQGKE